MSHHRQAETVGQLVPGLEAREIGALTKSSAQVEGDADRPWPDSLETMSSGQKAMIALEYLFSMLKQKKGRLLFIDDVDGMFDEPGSNRFSDMLGSAAQKCQIIIVTRNRVTIHSADLVYEVFDDKNGVSTVRIPEIVA